MSSVVPQGQVREAPAGVQRRTLHLAAMIDNSAGVPAREASEMLVPHPFLLVRCQSPMEHFFNPPPVAKCVALSVQHSRADVLMDADSEGVCTRASSRVAELPHNHRESPGICTAWHAQTAAAHWGMNVPGAQLVGRIWCLSTTPQGCRIVQSALEDADNTLSVAIATELRGHVWEAVHCQHANHVLQKCITKLAPQACQFILDELRRDAGSAKYLARHRYGCRVFERLLEHCSTAQLQSIVDDALGAAIALCAHPFGNYVMQHILEHGSCNQRRTLAAALVVEMPRIAAARHSPVVLGKALRHCDPKERAALACALLRDPVQIVRLARGKAGHAAVEQLLRDAGGEEHAVRRVLEERVADIQVSRYGRTVARVLGQSLPSDQPAAQPASYEQ